MSGSGPGPELAAKAAAIVLAAGASTRLGEPKQLVRLGGETLLERAMRIAREAGCSPVIVVLGADAGNIRATCSLRNAIAVNNEQWREGMASSIRAGMEALCSLASEKPANALCGVLLMTCDQPAVTPDHLRALMATGEITASAYAGRRGVPAYFSEERFGALSDLRGNAGARELLQDARAVALESGELDIDTPEQLEEARRLLA